MKNHFTNVNRYIIGILFIFSGLIKANDPSGLSYKMQEFFEAWGWISWYPYSLLLSIIMNCFEIIAGIAIILRWKYRLTLYLLLTLIIFFTFLTGYALFSGKIATCGCFGDCLPLSPAQSFSKDLLLLGLILFNLFFDSTKDGRIKFRTGFLVIFSCLFLSIWVQYFVLNYLPFIDCLPYKIGNNILEQMQTPPNAIPDQVEIYLTYTKNGQKIEFSQNEFPDDFDESYVFVGRKDKIVKKGNGLKAKIADFILNNLNGEDTTQAIFEQEMPYYLIFTLYPDKIKHPSILIKKLNKINHPIFIVTADTKSALKVFGSKYTILEADATNIKTAARVNPTIFKMNKANIINKVSDHFNLP